MPKRYRVVGGASFTWEYSLEDDQDKKKPGKLLAKSVESFASEADADKAIKEMSNKEIKHGREGRPQPE
jgi:hypothetical protein